MTFARALFFGCVLSAGCGVSVETGVGAGGGGGALATSGSEASSSSIGSSGAGAGGATTVSTSTATSSGSGAGPGNYPCSPQNIPGCHLASPAECLALVDESGSSTPTLRISQLPISKPVAFATGAAALVASVGVGMNLPHCLTSVSSQSGGTFNWLLQLDLANGSLTTGGAKPVANPKQGYAFDSGTVQGADIGPVTGSLAFDAGTSTFSTTGVDVNVPIYLSLSGDPTTAILLPLHEAQFKAKLSADHGCVGVFNAKHLHPNNSCLATTSVPAFLTGGSIAAYISLEEADADIITALGESLCALIAGTGDGGSPKKCTRTNGVIDFHGDWCSTTNALATSTCSDAAEFTAAFAASAVKLD